MPPVVHPAKRYRMPPYCPLPTIPSRRNLPAHGPAQRSLIAVPTTKDTIRHALADLRPAGLDTPLGEGLEWVAECDGFVSLKLHTPSDRKSVV